MYLLEAHEISCFLLVSLVSNPKRTQDQVLEIIIIDIIFLLSLLLVSRHCFFEGSSFSASFVDNFKAIYDLLSGEFSSL